MWHILIKINEGFETSKKLHNFISIFPLIL